MKNSCGHQVTREQKFCPECGAAVVIPPPEPRIETFQGIRQIHLKADCLINIVPVSGNETKVTITNDDDANIQLSANQGTLVIGADEDATVSAVDVGDDMTIIRGRGTVVVGNITSVRGLTIVSGNITSISQPVKVDIDCPIGADIRIDADQASGIIDDLQSDISFNVRGDCSLKVGRVNKIEGHAGGDLKILATRVGIIKTKAGGDSQIEAESAREVVNEAGSDNQTTLDSGHRVTASAQGDCEVTIDTCTGDAIVAQAGGDLKVTLPSGRLTKLTAKAGGDIRCRVRANCQDATLRAGGDINGTLNANRQSVKAGGDNNLDS